MSENTVREAFEAWAVREGYRVELIRDSRAYDCGQTSAAWHAWTASRKQAMEEAAKLCERNEQGTVTGGSFANGMRSMAKHLAAAIRQQAIPLEK